eukprot:SAG31_NODE_1080_length_10027_cov_8.417204_1_plen_177_part_00
MEVRTWWTTLLLLLLLLLLAHAAAARKTRRHSSAGPTTKDWAQLSPAEREAAIAAGYRVESWRAYAHFGKLRSAIMNLEVPWSQMPAGLQQVSIVGDTSLPHLQLRIYPHSSTSRCRLTKHWDGPPNRGKMSRALFPGSVHPALLHLLDYLQDLMLFKAAQSTWRRAWTTSYLWKI